MDNHVMMAHSELRVRQGQGGASSRQERLPRPTLDTGITEADWTFGDIFRTEQRPPVDHDRVLKSPISEEPMQVENYMGVHIDWSPKDGVWLDSGELEAIINNMRLDPKWLRKVSLRLWEHSY